MIKSIEFFRDEYLPCLSRLTAYSATARALNISERAVYTWIDESRAAMKRDDQSPPYFFSFDEGEPRYFHQHVKSIIRQSGDEIESNFRSRLKSGHMRVNKWQGRTCWMEDKKLAGLDDETLEILGIPDRLLRVNGELVPETEWVPPPIDGVLAYLQSHSKSYAKRSSVDVAVSGRIGVGGVQQVAWQRPAPLQEVEVLSDVVVGLVTDTDPAELPVAARDEADEENVVTEAPSDEPEPSPMATAPEPALMPEPLPDYGAADASRFGALSPSQLATLERFNATRKSAT